MRIFTDSKKADWSLDLTIGSIRRVKQLTGVDLLDAKDGRVLVELAENPIQTVDVLYAIVQPQAQARGMNDEAFGESLDGDSLRAATDAFIEELVLFFLHYRPEIGRVLQALWGKVERINAQMGELALSKIEGPAVQAMMEAAYARAGAEIDEKLAASHGTKSGSSPG